MTLIVLLWKIAVPSRGCLRGQATVISLRHYFPSSFPLPLRLQIPLPEPRSLISMGVHAPFCLQCILQQRQSSW